MRGTDLVNVIGCIDDKLVEQAEDSPSIYIYRFIKPLCTAAVAVCLLLIIFTGINSYQETKMPQENTGDLAPMIYVESDLYIISEDQEVYAETDERLSFLGVIASKVDASIQPKEEFQSNDDIVGASIYRYEEELIVFYNDQCWVYRQYCDD